MINRLTLIIGLFCFLPSVLLAQTGKPFIHNYSPKEYKAHAQNWAAAQDNRGVIYIGNGDGVMVYDGESWRVITLPNKATPFSIAKGSDGRIYTGGNHEFGYITTNEVGESIYESLSSRLDSTYEFGRIVSIIQDQNRIVFESNERRPKMFVYSLKDESLDTLSFDRFQWNYQIGERTYFRDFTGFRYFDADSLKLVQTNSFYQNIIPDFFLPEKDGYQLLYARNIETNEEGQRFIASVSLYRVHQDSIDTVEPINVTAEYPEFVNFLLRIRYTNNFYNQVKRLPNDDILVVNRNSGVHVLDERGNLRQTINKEDGLQSDAVYGTLVTDKGNLFITMNKGIAHIEIASPISLWDNKAGLNGLVEAVSQFDSTTYVATHSTIYYLDGDQAKELISTPPIVNTQNWAFLNFSLPHDSEHNQYLASSNFGIYRIEDSIATQIIPNPPGGTVYELYQSRYTPERVYLCGGEGISSLIYQNGEWVVEGTVEAIKDDVRMVAEDDSGNLWLGTFRNGAIKMPRFENPEDIKPEDVKYYKIEEGLPSLKNVLVYHFDREIVFATEGGLYRYDQSSDKMIPETKLKGSGLVDGSRDVFSFVEDNKGNVWVAGLQSADGAIGVAKKKADGYEFYSLPFKQIPEMMVLAHYLSEDGSVWFGGSEGLYKYNPNYDNDYYTPRDILIRKVVAGQDSLLFGGNRLEETALEVPKIPYEYNSLRFEFALPHYGESDIHYRYRLKGFNDEWSDWTTDNKAVYTNLHKGNYEFEVEAKNIYERTSQMASYSINIKAPWYLRWWAFLIYAIAFIVIVWALVYLNTRRLEKDKEKLERIVSERTAEIQQQKEEIEQQAGNLMLANAEINQQKEEIEAQAESLKEANLSITEQNQEISIQKEAVERSYQNIQTLSEIGQKITQILNQKDLVQTVYDNVNMLMPAEFFGIGLYRPKLDRIDFEGFIEFGKTLPFHYDRIDDQERYSVKCLMTQKEIINNDFNSSTQEGDIVEIGEEPRSLVYLPLTVEDKTVGVITVQSTQPNAYKQQELTILRTLAAYTSIALDNVSAYQTIEVKNRNITDSIRYAQTIQRAILPHKEDLEKHFAETFVLYRPKDIVSGDFYWYAEKGDCIYLAAIDCTGHGVPGAFMSMIGHSILTEIINDISNPTPSQILEEANERLIKSLHQEKDSNSDGMDICLCVFEMCEGDIKIEFAGAKRPLHYILPNQKEITTIKGTSRHIGGKQRTQKPFEKVEITLPRGTQLYLTTDGLSDQNNPEGKKFGRMRFLEMLEKYSSESLSKQRELILADLGLFQDSSLQRDDMTIIGVKL